MSNTGLRNLGIALFCVGFFLSAASIAFTWKGIIATARAHELPADKRPPNYAEFAGMHIPYGMGTPVTLLGTTTMLCSVAVFARARKVEIGEQQDKSRTL
jgi:hypothetical protein